MEVHCGSCPAKYAVPDDKVRGKKVRIKCKHCSSPIVVDGTVLGGSPSAAPGRAQVAQPRAAQPAVAAARPVDPRAEPKSAPDASGSRLRLGGAAAAASGRTGEPALDSASSWREPAKERAPASHPSSSTNALWREPAATRSALKGTMLGIPAPATLPVRSNKATLLGIETPGQTAPAPAPAPARIPPPPPEPAVAAPAPMMVDQAPQARPNRSVKRTMLGIPAPAGELPLKPEAPRPAPEAPPIPTPVPEPPGRGVAELSQSAEPEWTVAVTDEDHQEMTTAQVVAAYSSGKIGDSTFIWAEGMDDWKNPFDIPLIAAQLESRGLMFGSGGDSTDDDKTVVAEAPSESKPSGVWREPGNWRQPEDAKREESDVSFDDVTVSMDSSRAAELLRAAGAMDAAAQRADALDQLMDDAEHDDVTVATDSRPFFAESRPLSDMMEGARALEAAQQRQQESLHVNTEWDDEPTAAMDGLPPSSTEAKPTGARNEDSVLFSLDALAQGDGGPKAGERKSEDEILIPPSTTSTFEPAAPRVVPAAFSATLPAGEAMPLPPPPPQPSPLPAAMPPAPVPSAMHSGPMPPQSAQLYPMMPSAAPKRGSRAWLWLLLFLLLAGAALAAAFYFKQPAKVWELLGLLPKAP